MKPITLLILRGVGTSLPVYAAKEDVAAAVAGGEEWVDFDAGKGTTFSVRRGEIVAYQQISNKKADELSGTDIGRML